jgi:hypothetical protein
MANLLLKRYEPNESLFEGTVLDPALATELYYYVAVATNVLVFFYELDCKAPFY